MEIPSQDLGSPAQDFLSIADFMSADPDRILFRSFQKANLRRLLYLQNQIIVADHRLRRLAFNIQSSNDDLNAQFLALNDLVEVYSQCNDHSKSYANFDKDTALISFEKVIKMSKPSEALVETIRSSAPEHIIELTRQLDPDNGWAELVMLADGEKGWARKLVERHEWMQKAFCRVSDTILHGITLADPLRVMTDELQQDRTRSSSLFTYPANYVEKAEGIVLNVTFCLLVIVPVCILTYIDNRALKLLVVLLFLCVTSIVASFLSNLIQKTSLALMAGYTAVLVVFLTGSIGSN